MPRSGAISSPSSWACGPPGAPSAPQSARREWFWKPISAMADKLLIVRGVEAGYPNKQILFGVGFGVAHGEVVALLGANGSGKSTVLNCVSGFIRPSAGSIRLEA